jgi:hypothetical protein
VGATLYQLKLYGIKLQKTGSLGGSFYTFPLNKLKWSQIHAIWLLNEFVYLWS